MKKYAYVILLALLATCLSAQAQGTSVIVWSSQGAIVPEDPQHRIWKMRDGGGSQIPVTNPDFALGEEDHQPSICKGLGKVVFNRTQGGNSDIYIVDLSGANEMNLTETHDGTIHEDPDCGSPDGTSTKIVYKSNRDEINGDIYMMNLNGDEQSVERLTENGSGTDPAWCGETNSIVYALKQLSPDYEILRLHLDTGIIDVITNNEPAGPTAPNDDRYPSCDPDAEYVAYTRILTDGPGVSDESEVWRSELTPPYPDVFICCDNNVQPISAEYSCDLRPTWSPGGTTIAFTSDLGADVFRDPEDFEVYKIVGNTPTTPLVAPTQLTFNASSDKEPNWSER